MKQIGEIDRNLAVKGTINGENLCFYDSFDPPFKTFGAVSELRERYLRIPSSVAENTSADIVALNRDTAGIRVRFCTDSSKIAVRAKMPNKCLMPHMAFCGSSGFDMYINENESEKYAGTFIPPLDRGDSYESMITLAGRCMRSITINFPLYDAVSELLIGLEPDSLIEPCGSYRNDRPIIFYGSSITQGGCASRPGNCYSAIISRNLNCDYRNLGFSGNARGEQPIADYIASQPMELFFCDYDHNAPDPDHLKKTHEPLFLTVREKNPDLPVILATRTDIPRMPDSEKDFAERRKIVHRTYENAVKRGDKNIIFIDGSKVFMESCELNLNPDCCTVDGCHPNDLGFACMAKVYGAAISKMLEW